jgi:hypothetical protein
MAPAAPKPGDHYRLLAEREELYTGVRVVADVAILHSPASQDRFGSDDPRADGYVTHVRGFELALFGAHEPFDVLPQAHLSLAALLRYRVVVLPNAACLSDADCEALRAYVDGGAVGWSPPTRPGGLLGTVSPVTASRSATCSACATWASARPTCRTPTRCCAPAAR